MEVRFCAHCNKSVERRYLYCPYCGTRQAFQGDFDALLDIGFKHLERREGKKKIEKLLKLEARLSKLEQDLEIMFSLTPVGTDDFHTDSR